MKSGKCVIVTGAGGLVGRSVCEELVNSGYNVLGIYRTLPSEPVWDYRICDLSDPLSVTKDFWNDAASIVHCAAAIPSSERPIEKCCEENDKIDNNIYLIAKNCSIEELLNISSASVYGFSDEIASEESPLDPPNAYSESKIRSEQLFATLPSSKLVNLRINAPYHFSQKHSTVLKTFVENAYFNRDIFFHGTGGRMQDFTHVSDISKAVLSILDNGVVKHIETYNISGGNPINMKNLAQLILSVFSESTSKILPSGLLDDQEDYIADFSLRKIKDHYGWRPIVTLEEGLYEWRDFLKRCC